MIVIGFIFAGIFLVPLQAASLSSARHFVLTQNVITNHLHSFDRNRRSTFGDVTIERFRIKSNILSRCSRVDITSYVTNNADVAKDVKVAMKLPKNAFVSNFSMIIDSVTYIGEVKEKEAAKTQYLGAVSQGQSAGLVEAKPSSFFQTFDVSVNVAAGKSVTFQLTYQELLLRKHGFYKQDLYVNPGQVVNDIKIEVEISEPSGIENIIVIPPSIDARLKDRRSLALDRVENLVVRQTKTQAYVIYTPSIEQQEAAPGQDLSLTVTYDVTRVELGGDLIINDGYFVHFFAPDVQFPTIPKNIVFIIDKSGSMGGAKIRQTKEAFSTIIDSLKEIDQFNIITFDASVKVWKPNKMVEVTPNNLQNAKKFVGDIRARGLTNFYDSTIEGINLLETITGNAANTLEEASMLVVLTDGLPNRGKYTSTSNIVSHVTSRVNKRYCIFSLGFGNGADMNLLRKLSSQNCGIARKIFETSDAALQLKGFYDEVATPLLAHVLVKYEGMETSNITQTSFDKYFKGSEILVAGKIQKSSKISKVHTLEGVIKGKSRDNDVTLISKGKRFGPTYLEGNDFCMEKLWAYLTIKELLKKKTFLSNNQAKQDIDAKILKLSIRYNFVTPLTSMVVTKPNARNSTLPPILPPTPPKPRPFPLPIPSFGRGGGPLFSRRRNFFQSLGGGPSLSTGRNLFPSFGISSKLFGTLPPPSPPSNKVFATAISLTTTTTPSPPATAQSTTTTTPSPPATTQSTTTTTPSPPATTQSTTTTTPSPPTATTTTPSQPATTTTTPSQSVFAEKVNEVFNFTSIESSCGENLTLNVTQNITSPRYPGLYPANSKCVWKVDLSNQIKGNSTLRLSLLRLDIEGDSGCKHDMLLVFPDAKEQASMQEGKRFCGFAEENEELEANENFVVVFEADNVVQGRGFLLNVEVV